MRVAQGCTVPAGTIWQTRLEAMYHHDQGKLDWGYHRGEHDWTAVNATASQVAIRHQCAILNLPIDEKILPFAQVSQSTWRAYP